MMREEPHCKRCGSSYGNNFPTEVCIHIPGQENWTVPPVLIFPRLEICLDCGAVSEFRIAAEHLTELRKHVPRDSGSL